MERKNPLQEAADKIAPPNEKVSKLASSSMRLLLFVVAITEDEHILV